jgi:[ribosomal protein S5]-alanine N-acetyltransferase
MHFVNGEVRLRPIQKDLDLDFILEFANSQEIVRHTLGRRFPSQASSVADWINSSNTGEFPTRIAMIIETDESKHVGLVQVDQINWVSRNGWFGIWLVKDQRRKGYGEVSIKAIINYSFATLGLRQLRLVVKADNSAAIGLYETIGFTQEGVMRDAEFVEGKFHDLVIMGLNKL